MASGGIEDYDTAIKYLEVGADRIGTSTNFNNTKPINNPIVARNIRIYKKHLELAKQKHIESLEDILKS